MRFRRYKASDFKPVRFFRRSKVAACPNEQPTQESGIALLQTWKFLSPFDWCLVSGILVLMMVHIGFVFLDFRGADGSVFSVGGLVNYAHHLSLLLALAICCFLMMNFHHLLRPSTLTLAIIGMGGYLVMTSVFWEMEGLNILQCIESSLVPAVLWALVYLMTFVLARKCAGSSVVLVPYFLGMLIFCGWLYQRSLAWRSANAMEETQLNEVYYVVLLLPWILMIKRPVWRWLGVLTVAFLTALSVKRTAFVVLAGCLLCYLLVHVVVDRKQSWMRSILFACGLLLFGGVAFFCYDEYRGGIFAARFQKSIDDEGSGRLDIYRNMFRLIAKSAPEQLA